MSAADASGTADIIAFPQHPGRTPDCRICEHSISSADGTYCRMFEEEILSERGAAKDCEAYEEDDFK